MATAVKLHRASEFLQPVLGERLDAIAGQEVVLTAISITSRQIEGRQVPFCEIYAAPLDEFERDSDAPTTRYTAWSAPLAERLEQLRPHLPVVATFKRSEKTSSGYQAWLVE
jgi:hypothetical protein